MGVRFVNLAFAPLERACEGFLGNRRTQSDLVPIATSRGKGTRLAEVVFAERTVTQQDY